MYVQLPEFNLEEAKAWMPVCTRTGKPCRIICFDRKLKNDVVMVVLGHSSQFGEVIRLYSLDGRQYHRKRSGSDLMMMQSN